MRLRPCSLHLHCEIHEWLTCISDFTTPPLSSTVHSTCLGREVGLQHAFYNLPPSTAAVPAHRPCIPQHEPSFFSCIGA